MKYTYERTAAAKYDVYGSLMAVHDKAKKAEHAGVLAILTKISKVAKTFGYELDLNKSYIEFRVGRSDPDRPEGQLWFKPLPTRPTWASADEMRTWLEGTLDLYGVASKGDGEYVTYVGG